MLIAVTYNSTSICFTTASSNDNILLYNCYISNKYYIWAIAGVYTQSQQLITSQNYEFYNSLLSLSDSKLISASLFLSSIWTLQFTQMYPSFCISHRMKNLDIVMLNYVSVLYHWYLLFSLILLCKCMLRIIISVEAIRKCFMKLRRHWSATDSIIHAFATLIFLSFALNIFTAFIVLNVTDILKVDGGKYGTAVLWDPSVAGYSSEHIPYAAIPLAILFFFGFCPILLLCCIHFISSGECYNTSAVYEN